jgi:hypothetical protein
MPLYSFYVRTPKGVSISLETHDAPTDGEAFQKASEVLRDHYAADHIEIWDEDRAVAARYREQPVIRPVQTRN